MEIPAHHRHLFNGHQELLTPDEVQAWRNLQVARLIEHCEYPAVKELFRVRWLTDDTKVLALLKNGSESFYRHTLKRLEGKTRNCPQCSALCRTSRARLCPECSHSWY
ncbi:MAG: hypothetical protein ABGY95_01250 [Rubritalea sp.]|uniref:hypothetical protein n=1 Tax=Rubritalea sp. TaxID=2109375 RepID=UPI0032423FD5